jgi:protein CpxP
MTDENKTTIDHDPNETPKSTPAFSGWSKRLLVGGLALVAVAGTGAAIASGGWGHGGWRHGGGFGENRFERMLDHVDATAEQEEKLWDIVDGMRDEVRPMMREFRDTREQLAALLAAPTIDRAAVETLRAGRIAAIDQASQKVSAALVEAAEVLTPEQRTKLAERLERARDRW